MRAVSRVAPAVGLLTMCLACTSDGGDSADPAEFSPPPMAVSVLQQRTDEGTREVGVRITNTGAAAFTVEGVRLLWSAIPEAPRTPQDLEIAPGRTYDLPTFYGPPDCEDHPSPPAEAPTAQINLSGDRVVTQEIDARGQSWLRRLYADECAGAALRAVVGVRFDDTWTRFDIDGDPYLRTAIV